MFKEVHFLSAAKMRLFPPSPDTVVISILDKSEEAGRPSLEGFRDVLRLQFEDSSEEESDAEPGSWPDEPSDDEHLRLSNRLGERIPALSDAREIARFIDKYYATFDQLVLVVHCHGGLSRSAAVAQWASKRFWAPLACQGSTEGANPRLLRLMRNDSVAIPG